MSRTSSAGEVLTSLGEHGGLRQVTAAAHLHPAAKTLLVAVTTGVVYALGAQLSWSWFGAEGQAATFFPAAGVSFAALVLLPRGQWVAALTGIAAAEFVVNMFNGLAVWPGVGYAIANSLQPLLGAVALLHVGNGRIDLSRPVDLARFVACGPVGASAVGGAVAGVVSVSLEDGDSWLTFASTWWIGDGLGILVVGGAIVAACRAPHDLWERRWVEVSALVWLSAALAAGAFWLDRPLLLLPLVGAILIVGFRGGTLGCAMTGLIVAVIVAEATARGHDFFDTLGLSPTAGLAYLQLALAMLIGGAFAIAAAIAERERAFARQLAAESARRSSEDAEQLLRRAAAADRYRAQLANALRVVEQSEQIRETSTRLLATHLGADRVDLHVMDNGSPERLHGLPSFAPQRRTESGIPLVREAIRTGRPFVVEDTQLEPLLGKHARHRFAALGIRSLAAVPVAPGGQLKAVMSACASRPRAWTTDEITLISETADRAHSAMERAHAIAALREREARYESLFTSIDEGFCLCELIVDAAGHAVDYRFLETNPRFEQQTGLIDATGKTALEMVPELERHWIETYSQVGLEGKTVRFEDHSEPMDRWFDVYAAPVEPIGHGRFVLVFNDITDRKRVEDARRRNEEAQRRRLERSQLLTAMMGHLEHATTVDQVGLGLMRAVVPDFADAAELAGPDDDGSDMRWTAGQPRQPTDPQATTTIRHPVDVRGSSLTLVVSRTRSNRPGFDDEDVALLGDLAQYASLRFARAEVSEEERSIALTLQQALLPDDIVSHSGIDLAARYVTGSDTLQVGGDWFETMTLPGDRIGFAVGDVVGSGVEAAAAMGRLRVALATLAVHWDDPGDVLTNLHEFATTPNGVDFATVCLAVLDPASGQVRYATAAHPPPIRVSAQGGIEWLDQARSSPIGRIAPPAVRTSGTVTLAAGDLLFFYSDGLIERRGEPITVGLDRLRRSIAGCAQFDVGEICNQLITQLTGGQAHDDDVVAMCVRFQPATRA